MNRDFSGWGVVLSGVLLAGGGLYAMWVGWEYVQLERGWSQFIAGAVALSGGVVTIAIGRLIRVLLRFTAPAPRELAARVTAPPTEAPAPETTVGSAAMRISKTSYATDPASASAQRYPESETAPVPEAPTELDRYTAGDETYVMFSDGSVEVHAQTGVRRYPTIAALRAEAGARRD